MLKISEAAKLGLHATALVAGAERRLSVADLARQLGVSKSHLAKVMQRLVHKGLVDSVRGVKGGFRLARPADCLTLLEVVEALDGEIQDARCLFGKPVCATGRCVLGNLLGSVASEVRDRLESVTLADFVMRPNQP
jgi:Rrf2 family iron-sulfur cluster assembly transcriptional regulator